MSVWRTVPLGQVATLQRGFDLPARARRRGPVPIVSSSGVCGWHDHAKVPGPGVVTGRYGTLGEVFFENVDFWPLNTTLWVADFHGNDERFVYYMLQRLNFAAHSGKSGVPGVNRNDLHADVVSLPATRGEQRAIATALTDCDRLIAVLERSIAKKQAMRSGVLQQLLSGSLRLPGFSGALPETPLRTIADGFRGAGLSKAGVVPGGAHPCVLYGELFTTYGRRIEHVRSRTNDVNNVRSRSGDVLMPGSTTTRAPDLARACAIHRSDIQLGGDINVLRPDPELVDSDWLAYLLTESAGPRVAEVAQGSTVIHLYVRDILELRIRLPTVREQRAVAKVLRDGDHEISALEDRLTKARAIKQGMMQQLLTGKTRLPVKETVS